MSRVVRGPKALRKHGLIMTAGLMALVGGAYLVSTFAADNATVNAEIEGEFVYAQADDFEHDRAVDIYKVKDAAGNFWELDMGGQAPGVKTGTRVKVAGSHKRSDLRHMVVTGGKQGLRTVGQPAATSTPAPVQAAEPDKVLAARSVKLAAVIVNFVVTDGSTALKLASPLMTQAQGTAKYTTDPGSVRNYYLQSTENQLDVATQIVGPVTIQVSGTNATTCAYDQWGALADAAAKAAGTDLSAFSNVQYELPLESSPCNWAGIGYVGGSRSWIRNTAGAAVYETTQAGASAHELGHNLGMHHSNSMKCTNSTGATVAYGTSCSTSGYGDPFDTMGSQPPTRLLSAQHRGALGMLPAKSTATATASGTYTLSSVNVPTATAGVQSLRFAAGADTLELEYRSPFGTFDNFSSSDPAVNGVTIRKVITSPDGATGDTQLIDMTPLTASTADAPLVKGAFYDPTSKTSVTVLSRTTDTITVKLALGGSAVAPTSPTITSVSPTTYSKGQIVTITGSGFLANTGVTPLFDGAVLGHFAILSDTSIQFLAPAHATGTVPVSLVTFWGAKSNTVSTTYTTPVPLTVSGRITNSISGAGLGGISVQVVCLASGAGTAVTTAADGTYSFSVLPGDQYCVWPNKNLPTGAVVHPTSNRPEHPTWTYYWYQQAAVNAYKSPIYLGDSAYDSDLAADSGLDFKVDVPGTATPTPSPTPTPSMAPKTGDVNNDGKVNVFDLSILLSDWGKSISAADLNHDSKVNVFDLSILLSNWTP